MTVKSLHTRYAGCHFRSRLEARWAVFFNEAGIAWEYEPQGFEVTDRLNRSETTFRYLPDFWLPDLGVWAEVKGELDDAATERLLNAAASLSSNDGAGCHDEGGHDLAVFGPLTTGSIPGPPIRLHMHKGDLLASCLWCRDPHGPHVVVADDCDGPVAPDPLTRQLLDGFACFRHGSFASAYTAARSARFEFGRRGR